MSPAFAFEATSAARTADSFARAWKVRAADRNLLDDALRDELMRFLSAVRSARAVSVGSEGLRVTWRDDAGMEVDPKIRRDAETTAFWEKSQAANVAAAAELATRLRKRLVA